ncbi:MAG: hypothetical protein GY862_01200 [Gammaproteobacteria bacterium]|nr:hypothetical protein [Gammaproteobacteria bacterium]
MKNFIRFCLIVCLSGIMTGNAQAYNVKALAIHPDTNELYIVSGDDAGLYRVDALTGDLTPVGTAGFAGMEALSFHPDGTLWGWLKGKGVIKIDVLTGESEMVILSTAPLAGMVWNGSMLYGALGAGLWSYDGLNVELVCDLSQYTPSLEILSKDTLLLEHNGAKIQADFNALNQDTCELMPKPSVSLEWERSGITLLKGTWHKTAFSVNFSLIGGQIDYRVRFNRTVSPDYGIVVSSDYPAEGWSARSSGTFAANEAVYGLEPGFYTVTGTAVIENTGESYSKMLMIRVMEPDPKGDLSIISPSFSPREVNLDEPVVEVIVTSRVTGTKNPPAVLTLEEVDENGFPVAVLGELNDYGVNGDYTAGDFVYTGRFTIAGGPEAEGRRAYRSTAIFNGRRIVSQVDFFTVTRFPLGVRPFSTDYLVEDPAGGPSIYLDELTISFMEGVSPDRIEEIATAENAVVSGTTLTLGLYYLDIISDGTLNLLKNTVAAFKAYPEVKYVHLSTQNAVFSR